MADDTQSQAELLALIKSGKKRIQLGAKSVDFQETDRLIALYEKLYGPLTEAEFGRSGPGRSFMTTRVRFHRGDG